MDKIAVLIPCYNEGKTIGKVVSDWKRSLPEAVVYVYDNNSTDDTVPAAQKAGAVVRREPCQGKGNVVRRMFREIDAEAYVMVDGDDTYPAECGPALVREVLENRADMVVGDRLSSTYFRENKRPFHNMGNASVRWAINRIFRADIRDIMTGCRAFSYLFVKTVPVLSGGFEIETEMTVHALDKRMLVKNVVIGYRDRPSGSVSKLRTVPDGLKVIRKIFSLFRDYKPLSFFSAVSLALMLLALILFFPVLREYLSTGLVPRFPTLIVSGFVGVCAILSFFAGLILESVRTISKQDFEFRLYEACRRGKAADSGQRGEK